MRSAKDNGIECMGDIASESFKEHAQRVIDRVLEYASQPEKFPVMSKAEPGQIKRQLPQRPPRFPEAMKKIMCDFERIILPGITHWNHPGFLGYFGITSSRPAILGKLLSAALNVNAMLWKTSPAATELEEVVVDWLRQWLGLPREFDGILQDTASISTLCAVVAARDTFLKRQAEESTRLILYTSDQAHFSVEKAAMVAGIGRENVRKIASDKKFRLRVDLLEDEIAKDIKAGHKPFCLVATIGTTSTTSVDPIRDLASLAKRYRLWFHIDAAYAGAAALLPEKRHLFEGWERADSIVVNPHKWLFVPLHCSAFYCRDFERLRESFSLEPAYLKTKEGKQVRNYKDYSIQLGSEFRALPLWMTMRSFGREGIKARLREHILLAKLFANWVKEHPDFELMAPVPFSVVCFRFVPRGLSHPEKRTITQELNRLNQKLLDEVNRTGKVFLSATELRGKFVLRLAIGNIATGEEHIRLAWEILKEKAEKLTKPYKK